MEMLEGFGAMESQFADYRGEFTNYRVEFKDYRGEFRSFAERTDANFKTLDEKYGEISVRLADILGVLQTQNQQALTELKATTGALLEAVHKLTDPQKHE